MLKIIGGIHRTRRLLAPPDAEVTRPYTARIRESVFAELRGHIDGARVLDLFAGVGTMGLEAASRGAAEVVMIERDREVFAMLEANIDALQCAEHVRAVRGDALGEMALAMAPRPIDVLFVDPPYSLMRTEEGQERMERLLALLAPMMHPDGWLVLRRPSGPEPQELALSRWVGPEIHRHGREMLVLYYQAEDQADDHTDGRNDGGESAEPSSDAAPERGP